MITNIDENLEVLLERLEHWGKFDHTILIFMGDNGSCMGVNAYPDDPCEVWSETFNGGMRGSKVSHYDGGHRLFCYVPYPNGKLTGGRGVRRLTAHIDILPTPLCIGAEQENPVQLTAHDWMPPMEGGTPPWNQPHVSNRREGNGTWNVRVARGGRYALALRERPAHANFPLRATQANLRIADREKLAEDVAEGATGVRFEVALPAGDTRIKTWLIEENDASRGADFVDVE